LNVSVVCLFHSIQILFLHSTRVTQVHVSPGEQPLIRPTQQQIGHEASVATVSVWEGMDLNELMVESDSYFVDRERAFLEPVFNSRARVADAR